jgi:hypothetical protein
MRWRSVVLFGLLALWLGGCLDLLTRGGVPASTLQGIETDPRTDDLPTPRMFRFEMDLPSE